MCALLTLAAPLAAMAQQTVFYDTFGSSTLNQTNAFPGGTPTASSTSYTIGSPKVAPSSSIAPGHLGIFCPATSSANGEAQAMFTRFPVTLATNGDYVEMTYTFTDKTNQLSGVGGNSTGLYMGLFNSGGVPPIGGNVLTNAGFASVQTAYLGGTAGWVGYNAQMNYSQTANTVWTLKTRPSQAQVNNLDQVLLFASSSGYSGGGSVNGAAITTFPFPNLTVDSQYTAQLRITLSNASLIVSNGLYVGIGTGGALIWSNVTTWTGANLLTTNFDGLAIGFRAGGGTTQPSWTNDINSITVVAGLAAQAGPYFTLTTSGNGCGGAPIGLSGSVTTNVYMLYTNGVFNGNSLAGTGSALDFGFQSLPALYTIVASNIVTASVGPMQGSQTISQGVPVINSQPASVSCVTNYTASFGVAASGNSLNYKWYKNGIGLTNGGDISGATTTNLVVSPAQAADAATTANGYYVVVNDPCGNSVTSSPNASLTLLAPNYLDWQGGNPNNTWDLATTLNFTNPAGAFEAFSNADSVTFDDTSANTSVVISNTLVATLVTVNGTQNYSFAGPGSITGFGGLIDNDSGQVTITGANTYTGGTVISSNATLNLGNNSSGYDGSVAGVINIKSNGVLNYNYYNNNATFANSPLAGSGTVNYESYLGGTLTLPLSATSSNFTGVANLVSGVRVHAQNGSSFPFGNGSTVNVQPYSQAWCDTATFNNTFNIAGTGWTGTTPITGAISVFGSIFTGKINLTADARISGTISGGTILCAISGPHQLEIWGTQGSYVLSMGPTNGVHSYASTLITSGTVRALNTNAISTGPLAMDVAGDLRLNGYNLTVANLSSVTGNPNSFTNTAPTIQNTSTTNATLTVGADNTSTEFDGVFFNGGTGSLGLTKVGTGTLTLTGASTNTGTVAVNGGTLAMSGSGSFGKAAVIAPASGAIYDVSAAGGTLTLNSGQYLEGNGTLAGILSAPAGSIVNPGLSMGTLTVSGSATVNGIYRSNLNRTNAPSNCSQLASSGGSITYSGATLSVTNLGPKLQVGDFFQLFPGATAGFSTIQLQTDDVPHNARYTWANTVVSDGRITVASVSIIVNPNPTNIVTSVSTNSLTLSWPADHAGWTLQTQTNSLTKGISTNWVDVANSALTNKVVMPIVATNGSVFFRMVFTNTP